MSRGGEVIPPIRRGGARAKRPWSQSRAAVGAKKARCLADHPHVEHCSPFSDRGRASARGDPGGTAFEDFMGDGPPASIAVHHKGGQIDAMAVFCRESVGNRVVHQMLHMAELVLLYYADPPPRGVFGPAGRVGFVLKGVCASDIA